MRWESTNSILSFFATGRGWRLIAASSAVSAAVRYASICDASIPTYTLAYFVRDRSRAAKMPLEAAVAKFTGRNAALYGMADRGVIEPGRRADLTTHPPGSPADARCA